MLVAYIFKNSNSNNIPQSQRKKCLYSEFLDQKNSEFTDQKNSEYGQLSRSEWHLQIQKKCPS